MKCDFAGDVVEGEIVCGNDVDSEDGFHSEEVDENDESNKTPYKFDDQDEFEDFDEERSFEDHKYEGEQKEAEEEEVDGIDVELEDLIGLSTNLKVDGIVIDEVVDILKFEMHNMTIVDVVRLDFLEFELGYLFYYWYARICRLSLCAKVMWLDVRKVNCCNKPLFAIDLVLKKRMG